MRKYKNVIVGIDISPQSDAVFEKAMNIAKTENSSLLIISAVNFDPDVDIINTTIELGVISSIKKRSNFNNSIKERNLIIKNYIKKAKNNGIKNIDSLVEIDTPSNLILKSIDNFDKTLIVIGATTKNILKRFVLGSTAQYLAVHAPCNILIVKSYIK